MGPATRATTSRLAKDKAQARMKRLVGDAAVNFPNIPGYVTIDEDFSESGDTPPQPDMEYDARISVLEGNVHQVRQEVAGINSKLDVLVNVALSQQKPKAQSTPPASRQLVDWSQDSNDTIPYVPMPKPSVLRREANYDGHVDRLMRADRFNPPHNEGKQNIVSAPFVDCPIAKPYMYIQREECQTLKQKLEVRGTEGHMQDVTGDAMDRPWSAVRRWSQFIWDAIERGDMEWADRQAIQNERMRIAMTARDGAGAASNHPSKLKEYLCRDFNAKSGCKHRSHHTEDNVRVLHYCAFCDTNNKMSPHSVFACNSKRLQQHPHQQYVDHHHMYPPAPHQQWRQPTQSQQFSMGQFQPKNGMQAPRV